MGVDSYTRPHRPTPPFVRLREALRALATQKQGGVPWFRLRALRYAETGQARMITSFLWQYARGNISPRADRRALCEPSQWRHKVCPIPGGWGLSPFALATNGVPPLCGGAYERQHPPPPPQHTTNTCIYIILPGQFPSAGILHS